MNRVVGMTVETPGQLVEALRMSQSCCLENTNILVCNKDHFFAEPARLESDVRSHIHGVFGSFGGSFANAQLYDKYCIKTTHDRTERYCKTKITAVYHYTESELNSLICLAAEIAEDLNDDVASEDDMFAKVRAFARWVKEYIRYEDLYDDKDCSAINLLVSRHGVCQAIAAIAVPILSCMGVKTLYVLGEGKGEGNWGVHAWNVVNMDGRWAHVDFTFGLNMPYLPNTWSAFGERLFKGCHRWDADKYSDQELDAKWDSIQPSDGRNIQLILNDKSCSIDGITVRFEKPILILRDGNVQIALYGLLRLLGGGAEYKSDTRQVILCIKGKRIILENGMSFINNGYFDIRLINRIGTAFWRDESVLEVVI